MTREGAPARPRSPRPPRDPYGIGPVSGLIGPVIAAVGLILVAALTLSLMNGDVPFFKVATPAGGGGGNGADGATPSPAPPDVVITPPSTSFPGVIAYAKAGNIWVQTGKEVRQITTSGNDSQPTFSADGAWIYFIRINPDTGKFPSGGFGSPAWYDLDTPAIWRMKPDGSAAARLLNGSFRQGGSTWYFFLRQPVPSPDGTTIAVVSDGPNPLQSDIVLKTYDLAKKKLTALNVPESLHLGHQDPAWRPDGKALLYVRNGRDGNRGAPQIFRYDVATGKTRAVTGPGYLSPAYSPDGAWIAATRTDSFGSDVVILDPAGKEALRITSDGHSFSPIWSPAGNAVAFLHLEGTIVDLRMATVDQSTGQWTVTKTVDLTTVSGLDGASRPSWFIPSSELRASNPGAGSSGGPAASTTP